MTTAKHNDNDRSMTTNEIKMQPWQVFAAAIKGLTAERVARIFNKQIRSAYNWGQDPAFTEERCRNPLELLHSLFNNMDAVGFGWAARAGIRYLETAVDPEVRVDAVQQLLPTIQEELLADYRCLAEFQRAIEGGRPVAEVHELKHQAFDEIERSFSKYRKEMGCGR